MENFNPSHLNSSSYRSVINQSGSGGEIDRYIYSQSGEGIGSFFGNLIRTVVPLLGQSIKGAAKIAKPYLQDAAKEIVVTGAKRAVNKISGPTDHKKHSKRTVKISGATVHKKHSKRRRKKWQSL